MSAKTLDDTLQKLTKWRKFFATWQLGTRPADDGEYKAVAHLCELHILMRAELNAMLRVLAAKGVITLEEFNDILEAEARHLDKLYQETYPGFQTSLEGLHMRMPKALETMRDLGFPP